MGDERLTNHPDQVGADLAIPLDAEDLRLQAQLNSMLAEQINIMRGANSATAIEMTGMGRVSLEKALQTGTVAQHIGRNSVNRLYTFRQQSINADIADETGLTPRQARDAIERLRRMTVLTRVRPRSFLFDPEALRDAERMGVVTYPESEDQGPVQSPSKNVADSKPIVASQSAADSQAGPHTSLTDMGDADQSLELIDTKPVNEDTDQIKAEVGLPPANVSDTTEEKRGTNMLDEEESDQSEEPYSSDQEFYTAIWLELIDLNESDKVDAMPHEARLMLFYGTAYMNRQWEDIHQFKRHLKSYATLIDKRGFRHANAFLIEQGFIRFRVGPPFKSEITAEGRQYLDQILVDYDLLVLLRDKDHK